MACGIPVVNTGYLPATADNSWMAKPQNAASLAEQVLRIVADPAEAALRRARALEAVEPFAWDAVAGRMIEVFRRCS
jgi:glycosyltransferase involved in cell wall biosynthesis